MRLTHIKLAGFKTFVDPTNIPTPGNLVGIVGPNGCGKSNVIDAVRWVLGESSARQLRGESMQDVIFNGSGTRKPVSRASVELCFDNSLGRAAGAWSQYAEITVKRVLHRDGESTYLVNNIKVRRRDVTDIFLGTGLGPRAYAIIEQGMISRIIEARPEELRVFLEEAAGVSKYKERRRETEARLRDTRENMLRVDDIRLELDKQLARLETQAAVAQQYQDLQGRLATARNLLTLAKRREAAVLREKHQRDVQRLINELEAETARLRQAENRLEAARTTHYSASDALHGVQAALYEANAEVARIEQSVKHQRENRERLAGQINTLHQQQEQALQRRREAGQGLEQWRRELTEAQERSALSRETLAEASKRLPEAEQAFRRQQQSNADLQRQKAETEQAQGIVRTNHGHSLKSLQQLQAREARLRQELSGLPLPEQDALAGVREKMAEASRQLEALQSRQEALQLQLPEAESARNAAFAEAQQAQQQITRLDAQIQALEQLQQRAGRHAQLDAWLGKYGLDGLPRLWQGLRIEAGWEAAVEAVLRERLNAVLVDDLAGLQRRLQDEPPSTVAVAEQGAGEAAVLPDAFAAPSLASLLTWEEGERGFLPAFLQDWLHGIYIAADSDQAESLRSGLPPGAMLLCPDGHGYSRHGLVFHGESGELHGVLARKRELETLAGQLQREQELFAQRQQVLKQAEAAQAVLQGEYDGVRGQLSEAQRRFHALQMESQKLEQQKAHVVQRLGQIEKELGELGEQTGSETQHLAEYKIAMDAQQERIAQLQEQIKEAGEARRQAETELSRQRDGLRGAEREVQEAVFHEKTCSAKITELEKALQSLAETLGNLETNLEGLLLEQTTFNDGPVQDELQQALNLRLQREQGLTQAREAMTLAEKALREVEEERLNSERGLNPLRDKLGEARLKEQEARINEEQLSEHLREVQADETELAALLEKNARPAALQSEIDRLGQDVAALGAVNLAALEELKTERERKQYLDDQAADLTQAVETLEDAIRRIDRETRGLLQDTYDQVNRNLGELFPTLFGGGQARLVLTGDEILDAGIQVIAQPPGKKNSSIHLLSGGEKALTAISLTFSLFRLNPAPFCLLDEVDAPLDDSNTERLCNLVKKMSEQTQFLFISHNKITMGIADQLIGITMQELGASRMVAVDFEEALRLSDQAIG
ncbi:MAG: chromosome segregation protein SMC [Burkholderiales bacterium]